MSNLALVTDNMLPVANETFIDNLSAGISAGAAIVPINSLSEYSDGDSVVLTVDPGTASQATFIGEKQGNTVIDCKWTEGNVGASHAAGATVIDYDSSTHYNVITKLLRMFATEQGGLKTAAVQAALNISSAVPADWTPLANVPSVTANNGQKEHVLTFTGVDYTDRLQPGTKLRIPRTTPAPTQSMDFTRASSHYAQKAAPAGLVFTDDFTIEAWIKPRSYVSGDAAIVSRYNGTAGFILYQTASNQIQIGGYVSGNSRTNATYASPIIDKWTHVAATLDMSGALGQVYFDGVAVPMQPIQGGATALVQAGNLQIGAYNSTSFFDGQVADVRIWNTIRTASQIRDNMNKQLVGNEANLVTYIPGNGVWTDLTANANTLTAVNGAVPTTVDNPFGSVEYGVITKVVKSGADTLCTVFTGDGTMPILFTAVSYSTARAPYGFPASRSKWRLKTFNLNVISMAIGATGSWNGSQHRLTAPIGEWRRRWQADLTQNSSVNGTRRVYYGLGVISGPTPGGDETTVYAEAATSYMEDSYNAEDFYKVTSGQPVLYQTCNIITATGSESWIISSRAPSVITLECAYI